MASQLFKHLIMIVLAMFFVSFTALLFPSASAAALIADSPASCQSPTSLEDATPVASPAPTAAAVATPSSTLVSPVVDIPVPGGATRFDYQSFDPTTGRLYISHMGDGQVLVFDTASRKVIATIDNLPTVTGVLAVPELGKVFASVTDDHQVAVIDASTNQVITKVGSIGFPDGLAYAPQAKRVFVSDESGGGELVIDATTNKVVETIDIGGDAGNTQYDPVSGCILVAVQTKNQLIAIDPQNDAIIARYDVDSTCKGPHGFALDASNRLLFLSCEDNATLLTIDMTSMQTIGTFSVGDGPDVLAFDSSWGRLYVASEAGTVTVFDERGGNLELAGEYRASHAHSVAVDPTTHLIYLPLQDVDGKPVLRIASPAPPTD